MFLGTCTCVEMHMKGLVLGIHHAQGLARGLSRLLLMEAHSQATEPVRHTGHSRGPLEALKPSWPLVVIGTGSRGWGWGEVFPCLNLHSRKSWFQRSFSALAFHYSIKKGKWNPSAKCKVLCEPQGGSWCCVGFPEKSVVGRICSCGSGTWKIQATHLFPM